MVPADERPQEGQVAVSVELTALCSPDARPGRFSEAAHCLNDQACARGPVPRWLTMHFVSLMASCLSSLIWILVRLPEQGRSLGLCGQPASEQD